MTFRLRYTGLGERHVKSGVEEDFSQRVQPRSRSLKYGRNPGNSSVAVVVGAKGRMTESVQSGSQGLHHTGS